METSSEFTTNTGLSRLLVPVDYVDSATGVHKRVLLPPGSTNYEEGIPAGLSLDNLYPDAPASFRKRLADELYAQGLIEPRDFLQPGAAEKTRAAFIASVTKDAQDIVNFAREVMRSDY